ncbi:hypothetical protein GF374_03650 [Candidatus Woesearchaeota archaeon]|nr:hypothetical protein [Candidatus Woesearchaeota archaeon]
MAKKIDLDRSAFSPAERKAAEQTIRAYRKVFGTPDGKKVLYHLMHHFHVTRANPNLADANAQLIREGQRSVVIHIINSIDLTKNEHLFLELMDAATGEQPTHLRLNR